MMMVKPLLLSLFDYSGTWSEPWKETHNVIRYDIQTDPSLDVLELAKDPLKHGIADVILAAPPCTHFTLASTRFWKQYEKDGRYDMSKSLVEATIKIAMAHKQNGGARILAIENPVGRIKHLFDDKNIKQKPLYKFNPYEYAGYLSNPSTEAYRKNTCIWGWGHDKPTTNDVTPLDTKVKGQTYISLLPPTKDRANIRSKTPEGFAYAFYQSNRP